MKARASHTGQIIVKTSKTLKGVGAPVTMMKDQSKAARASGNILVFLEKHPDYPNLKELADMDPKPVKPISDCNGFCIPGEEINSTQQEINFSYD